MENKINHWVDTTTELAIELTAAPSRNEPGIKGTRVLQSPHRGKENSSTMQQDHETFIQDSIPSLLPNTESLVDDDDNKSVYSTACESISDRVLLWYVIRFKNYMVPEILCRHLLFSCHVQFMLIWTKMNAFRGLICTYHLCFVHSLCQLSSHSCQNTPSLLVIRCSP